MATNQNLWEKSVLTMGTVIQLKVAADSPETEVLTRMDRALSCFRWIESVFSRFESSELANLSRHTGRPVAVSKILFDAIRFAREVADLTGGIFDPTVGRAMLSLGFDRHYLTGEPSIINLVPDPKATYRDIILDEEHRTVMLNKPLIIDLGAVAKGLAVDLASKEFASFHGFVIDAGGDIYAGGRNQLDKPWLVGIRHPVRRDSVIGTLRLSNAAVCTSGSYERISRMDESRHHLIHPFAEQSPDELLSSSVIAPFAMLADAFSTASFLLGAQKGIELLEQQGLEGVLVTSDLHLHTTAGMGGYWLE